MRVWGALRNDHRVVNDVVLEFPFTRANVDWPGVVDALCHELDLARPVILGKHLHDLEHFSRAVFKPDDFMEPVSFARFEVTVFPEEKKK